MIRVRRRFGLLSQLLTGFVAGGFFVALLMLVGDQMLTNSSRQLVATLEDHVRPLARLHRLQSRVAALRTQELELAGLSDVFIVQTHTSRMRSELDGLERELTEFSRRLAPGTRGGAEQLLRHWADYRDRLIGQIGLAEAMDMAGVAEVTSSGSHLPFVAIQTVLGSVAAETEAAAERAYQQTVTEQALQRRGFMVLVLVGSLVLVIGLAWSGRVVVRRIGILRDQASRLAAGEESGKIGISGHDEIGDLAAAFVTMREQVLSREAALKASQQELEWRVAARTFDLSEANRRLILFSHVVEQSPVGTLIADLSGQAEFVNAAYVKITGLSAAEVTGRSIASALEGDDSMVAAAIIERTLTSGSWEVERESVRPDGARFWERVRLVVVHDADGVPAHLLLSREDISERHAQQEKIAFQAHFDALTGLPNRSLAHDRLVQVTGRCRRDGGKAVAMFIDLDNFKQINDTLGHAAGDALLRQVARRLESVVRREDTVARLGGDEFLVMIGGLSSGEEAGAVAEKIIAAFAAPFRIDERDLASSPSIGISVYPDDGADPMVLLRNADLAMYEAKEAGRNTYRYFNQSIHDLSLQKLELGRGLRGALERNELHVVYHPLVSAESGRIIGAEALLRWHSPEFGPVSPDVFIPIAEQNGLIIAIGAWVMREACAMQARWRRTHDSFVMAVNVSPRQFRAVGFVETVRQCLQEFSLSPAELEIEITEGVLLRNQAEVKEILSQLRSLGVRLSMDDFGTGYSSLSYLREFPFQTIKIDRSFIRDVSDDQGDRALVVAAVRMAQAMGLQIIAEGVETDEQWRFLAEQECDVLQGFLFGRPVPAHEFAPRWLNAQVVPPRQTALLVENVS